MLAMVLSACNEKDEILGKIQGVQWIQEHENNILYMTKDNEMSYYEPGSGNAYHDFDLCNVYDYDKEEKRFVFEGNYCEMKILSFDEENGVLKMEVDGEEILFKKDINR